MYIFILDGIHHIVRSKNIQITTSKISNSQVNINVGGDVVAQNYSNGTDTIKIRFEGDLARLDCGSCEISGSVHGNVDSGSLKVSGNITADSIDCGSLDCHGDISARKIDAGSIKALSITKTK